MECPICNKGEIVEGYCGACGVTQRINQDTGNVVYFRGNKLVAMPQDKADRVKMKQQDQKTVEELLNLRKTK